MEEDISFLVEDPVADDKRKLVELWSWLVSNGGVNEANVNRDQVVMLAVFDCKFDVVAEFVSIVDEDPYSCSCVTVVCCVDWGDEAKFEDLEFWVEGSGELIVTFIDGVKETCVVDGFLLGVLLVLSLAGSVGSEPNDS